MTTELKITNDSGEEITIPEDEELYLRVDVENRRVLSSRVKDYKIQGTEEHPR